MTSLSKVSQNSPPVPSQVGMLRLNNNVLGHIFSFLGVEELVRSEAVCKLWRGLIASIGWKALCQTLLGLPAEIDPVKYLPMSSSYKESLQLIFSRVFGVYTHNLGAKIGPVPPLPLGRSIEQDRCDPARTVGANYELMYFPRDLIITVPANSPWYMDKEDNPNDRVAPRLVVREASLGEGFARAIGLGANQERRVLKVPLTINNGETLFKNPKAGYSSNYSYIWPKIVEQHGDERIPAGYTWMRKEVIGRNLTFAQQQALADENGVEIPPLLPRILFNLMENARSGRYPDGGRYPDEQSRWTFARTSTLTLDGGTNWSSGCGAGGPSGLSVYDDYCLFDDDFVGVAVALPAEVLRPFHDFL